MRLNCSLILIIFLVVTSSFAMETRGILKNIDGENAIVGEVNRYLLTLVPFEEQLLKKNNLEGKTFLDNFYVSEVLSIKSSQNNYDAVEVVLDLIPVRKFDTKKFYIWSLEGRNIPVDITVEDIKDVSLVQKNFSLFKTPSIGFLGKHEVWYGLGALLLALALGYFLYKLSRGRKKVMRSYFKSMFMAATKKEDLEALYFEKYQILEKVKDEKTRVDLNIFFQKYSKNQFSPDWKDQDVSHLLSEAREIGKELDSGI